MIIFCFPSVPREESLFEWLDQQLGAWIDQARIDAGMSHTEMWINAGYRDGSQWTRALQGQRGYPIDLRRLIRQPPRFWQAFLLIFMKGMTAFWFEHFWEDRNALRRTAAVAVSPQHLDRLSDLGRPRPVRASLDGDQRAETASRTGTRV